MNKYCPNCYGTIPENTVWNGKCSFCSPQILVPSGSYIPDDLYNEPGTVQPVTTIKSGLEKQLDDINSKLDRILNYINDQAFKNQNRY